MPNRYCIFVIISVNAAANKVLGHCGSCQESNVVKAVASLWMIGGVGQRLSLGGRVHWIIGDWKLGGHVHHQQHGSGTVVKYMVVIVVTSVRTAAVQTL